MKVPDPGDMVIFAKVAECGSISAAARTLQRPKASISRAITRLEAALGVRLLERSPRYLTLTEAGRSLLIHSKRIAEELLEAEAALAEMRGSVSGNLRVAVPVVFGRWVLDPILPEFMLSYPELRVEVQITNRVVDPIQEGFDMVVRQGPLDDSSLVSRLLGETGYSGYVSPGYLKRTTPIIHPRELTNHAILDHFNGTGSKILEFRCDDIIEKVKVQHYFDSNDAIIRRNAVAQGLGVGLLPNSVCREAVASGKLIRILPDWEIIRTAKLYALWPSRRNTSPRLRIFLDFLVERVPMELAGTGTR